ncbi:MAG: segregation/condensation protein A [Candidatus Micrarchaeota archaeon]
MEEETQLQITQENLNLETLVLEPTWREILLELVRTNQMNPWDLDLVLIADSYLQKVREIASIDLRLPANVILATSLLLRFKADALSLEETVQDELFVEETTPRELIQEEIPQLILRTNNARSRKVTLSELLSAVEEVINSTNTTQLMLPVPKILELELPKEDLHELIKKIYALANELKDENGTTLFSSLLDPILLQRNKGHHVASRLIPLLHLVQERKADVWQEQMFGEIKIKVL